MRFVIRAFDPADAPAVVDLIRASIRSAGPAHYSAVQVAKWVSRMPDADQMIRRCADGRQALVAVDSDDQVIAFGDLEADGHLDFLYCHPEFIGKGVASDLCNHLIKNTKTSGMAEIKVEASGSARPLFLRKGFVTIKRRDFAIDGVMIYNYAMRKIMGPNNNVE